MMSTALPLLTLTFLATASPGPSGRPKARPSVAAAAKPPPRPALVPPASAHVPPPKRPTDRLRAEASVFGGVDSNAEETWRNPGLVGALLVEADGSYARRLGDLGIGVAGLGTDLQLFQGEGPLGRMRLDARLGVAKQLLGRGRPHGIEDGVAAPGAGRPALRLELGARYRLGVRLVGATPSPRPPPASLDEEGEPLDLDEGLEDSLDESEEGPSGSESEGGSSGGRAFGGTFHDVLSSLRVRFEPRASTQLRATLDLRRNVASAEPGDPAPDYSELGFELGLEEDLISPLSVEVAYRLESRWHDALENGRGERLASVGHRPRVGLRLALGGARLRAGYELLYRDANRERRDILRHVVAFEAEYALTGSLALVAHLSHTSREAIDRPDRSWDRSRALLGARVLF